MKQHINTTLTHVYGVIGLVGIVVGLILGAKADSPWSEFAFFGSGWICAFLLWMFMVKLNDRADSYVQEIAQLKGDIGLLRERLLGTERELASRNQTLDFIAGLQITTPAKPRAQRAQKVKTKEETDLVKGDEK